MADRVDVPALLRRAALVVGRPSWYMPDPEDAAYLDRLADVVEAMLDTEAAYKAHDQRGTTFPEAQADVLALLRGEAP